MYSREGTSIPSRSAKISAMLDALAAVERPQDVAAVRSALQALYRPSLEVAARPFQQAVATALTG
jgi:hypothetical protein